MKRLITIFLCCILLALILAGCNGISDIIPSNITVTFDSAGGTQVNAQTIAKNSKISEPKDPRKTGYEFLGWYVDDEKWSFIGYIVSEDMTLTAKWELISYEITYVLGENAENGNNPTAYTINDNIELENPTRNGYTFDGWYLDSEFTELAESISEKAADITLYAKWIENQEPKYNYTMSEYIALPSLTDLTVDFELDELQRIIDSYLMYYAEENEEKTVAELGDVVNAAYKGYLLDESDNPCEEAFDENGSAMFYLGSHLAIDDFENGIVGAQIGQEIEFYATFPNDYEAGDDALALNGKKVLFKVTLNAIYDAPEYNDEFVQTNLDFSTAEELETNIKNQYVIAEVYDYIFQNCVALKYPEKEYNAQLQELSEMEESFYELYGVSIEEFIQNEYSMTVEEYIKSNMKNEMVYYAFAQQNEIVPTEEMLAQEKASLIDYYKSYYMSYEGQDEASAIASATDFVASLGEEYIYENVLYDIVEENWSQNANVNIIEKTYTSVSESKTEAE